MAERHLGGKQRELGGRAFLIRMMSSNPSSIEASGAINVPPPT